MSYMSDRSHVLYIMHNTCCIVVYVYGAHRKSLTKDQRLIKALMFRLRLFCARRRSSAQTSLEVSTINACGGER